VYSDPRIVGFVTEHFLPVRVHVREQKDEFKRLADRYGAHWTPTILVVDSSGQERHRIEGFLPTEDFLGQLGLGRGHSAFVRGDYGEAVRQFREVLDKHAHSDVAPEAMYWHGVARYKASGDAGALGDTHRELDQRYPESSWAKKASVWASPSS
jgi:hypothetical protein